MPFRAIVIAVAIWSCPFRADAQIYSWKDANGNMVLSDRSIDAATKVYDVERAPSFVTTKPVEITSDRDRYEPLIQEHARRQGLRPDLVRAVIQVESGFDKRALSPKGAMGLMQLMPDTARLHNVLNAFDPADNIEGGVRHLRMLLERFQGDLRLSLAAYNAGSGAVEKFGGIPPYVETREYVRRVLRFYDVFRGGRS